MNYKSRKRYKKYNHNRQNKKKRYKNKNSYKNNKKTGKYKHKSSNRKKRSSSKRHTTKGKGYKKSKPKLKVGYKILIFIILSAILTYLAFELQSSILKWLNAISWILLTFFLLKGIFIYVNKINLLNDLNIWLLRIIGVILIFIGLFFGISFFIGGLVANADPFSIGISILLFGVAILGFFMVFRFNRRYGTFIHFF